MLLTVLLSAVVMAVGCMFTVTCYQVTFNSSALGAGSMFQGFFS